MPPELHVVFHRAFDLTPDPFEALEQLIALGVTRVLTSGGESAIAPPSRGAERAARLVQQAAGRIEVLPAGGIRANNVADVLRVTGCRQVHSSCRRIRLAPEKSGEAAGASQAPDTLGFGLGRLDSARGALDPDELAALRRATAAVGDK